MCNCIETITTKMQEMLNCDGKVKTNWQLLEDGTLIEYPAGLEFVYHRKKKDGTLETKKSSAPLKPTFCPFCGKPL